MALLLLKLALTPVLIGGASLAARRWGPAVGGWLVALPLTSGPIVLYLALGQGASFAAAAAQGALGGLLGDGLFALAYARSAGRLPWPAALAAGSLAFAASAIGVQPLLGLPPPALLALVLAGMAAAVLLAPPAPAPRPSAGQPRWDVPARMVVGTAIVVGISEAAPALGPSLSGVVATFPVYVSVLTVFAHRLEGADQALGILRGLQLGLFGTAAFLATLSVALPAVGPGPAFLAAVAISLGVHGLVVAARRRSPGRRPARLPD